MKSSGQHLAEFIVILVLIVIAIVTALTLLGDQTKSLFGSSTKKTVQFKPFDREAAGKSDDVKKLEYTVYESDYGKIKSDGNGKASITLPSGAVINGLSSEFLEQFEKTLVKTTGASGTNMFLKSLDAMVMEYSNAHPDATSAPIDLGLGSGEWSTDDNMVKGFGKTAFDIKINEMMLLFYQDASPSASEVGAMVFPGVVEGNKLIVDNYYQNVDMSNPEMIFDPAKSMGSFTGKITGNGTKVSGNLNIGVQNDKKKSKISITLPDQFDLNTDDI